MSFLLVYLHEKVSHVDVSSEKVHIIPSKWQVRSPLSHSGKNRDWDEPLIKFKLPMSKETGRPVFTVQLN